ncbi:HNH endonuclease family protein [Prescottella sp. R16]|uniref:HNH endonuclease family protein n=1 Tax=Prescottella sp. R16 TaxID=3064529 RepID=UPI00272ECFBD|nr:HNH endonuclease family protein [Prescottella sp. R16]
MSGSVRRLLTLAGTVVLAVVLGIGYVAVDTWLGSEEEPAGQVPPSASSGEIETLLAQLRVAPEAPMTGYSREEFPHWDRNLPEHGFGDAFAQYPKCTTRDVMMLRDAVGAVSLDPKTCELTVGKGGGWQDEYGFIDRKTGEMRPYKKMTEPSGVDAEHIVALAEAWRSGAANLDEDTRRRIANDATNLVAADPSANRSKGDQDAANYLPPGKFRCSYVDRYLHVKVKYGLTVDPAEQTALRTAVDDCVRQGAFG